jgi:hypothetical protein
MTVLPVSVLLTIIIGDARRRHALKDSSGYQATGTILERFPHKLYVA